MSKDTNKSDGVLALLGTIIKKSVDLPEDVATLADRLRLIADDVRQITKSLSSFALTLHSHSIAIEELYTVQEALLRQLKVSGTDTAMPDPNKEKSQKPN